MYQNVIIESLDSFGRGVSHINNKVIFIPNALPEEIVDIKIVSDHKSYCEGIVLAYQVRSNKRIDSLCPYFSQCGGCQLLFYKYLDTIDYKLKKVIVYYSDYYLIQNTAYNGINLILFSKPKFLVDIL